MTRTSVDLVLVIDASSSMAACIEALRRNLDQLIQPIQGHAMDVQIAVLAHAASSRNGSIVYRNQFHGIADHTALDLIYRPPSDPTAARRALFTSDASRVAGFLAGLSTGGNEDLLLALDLAADLPFGPLDRTCRVIALFSDEKLEAGVVGTSRLDKLPALIDKLQSRRIKLFAAVPESPAAMELSMVNRSEIEFIDGGRGLETVDFSQLLAQMGRSISAMSLQAVAEPAYQRALFGQDGWAAAPPAADEHAPPPTETSPPTGHPGWPTPIESLTGKQRERRLTLERLGYVDHGDGTITDTRSGLMWADHNWRSALTRASTIRAGESDLLHLPATLARMGGHAGHLDWRIPTIEEAETLLLRGLHPSYCEALFEKAFRVNEAFIPTLATLECLQGVGSRDVVCLYQPPHRRPLGSAHCAPSLDLLLVRSARGGTP